MQRYLSCWLTLDISGIKPIEPLDSKKEATRNDLVARLILSGLQAWVHIQILIQDQMLFLTYLLAFLFSACSFIFALSASSSCQYSCCFPSFPIFLILVIVLIPFSLILTSHRWLSSLCHHELTCHRLLPCLLSCGRLRTKCSHWTCKRSSWKQALLLARLELVSRMCSHRTCRCSSR